MGVREERLQGAFHGSGIGGRLLEDDIFIVGVVVRCVRTVGRCGIIDVAVIIIT